MILQSRRVWIGGQFLEAQLEIQEGKIQGVYPYGTKGADQDYETKRVVPGFIDVHTHGAYGFDTNDGEPKGLREWMRRIPEEGVTGILPTTVTQMPDVLTKAVANVAAVVEDVGHQTSAIMQVTEGIGQISAVVQTNSATSEQCAAASEELNSQAILLQELLSAFHLKQAIYR